MIPLRRWTSGWPWWRGGRLGNMASLPKPWASFEKELAGARTEGEEEITSSTNVLLVQASFLSWHKVYGLPDEELSVKSIALTAGRVSKRDIAFPIDVLIRSIKRMDVVGRVEPSSCARFFGNRCVHLSYRTWPPRSMASRAGEERQDLWCPQSMWVPRSLCSEERAWRAIATLFGGKGNKRGSEKKKPLTGPNTKANTCPSYVLVSKVNRYISVQTYGEPNPRVSESQM